MAFDPQQHIMKQQGKDYLEVKWRLVWFKDTYAERGAISTDVISFEPLVVKAVVLVDGVIIATGHGSANAGERKVVWNGRELEKAETAAIGRALAHAGFGTQFAGQDLDEGGYADSPVERRSSKPAPIQRQAVQQRPPLAIDPQTEPSFDEQFPKSDAPNPYAGTNKPVKSKRDHAYEETAMRHNYGNRKHFDNLMDKLQREDKAHASMSVDELVEAIDAHYAAKAAEKATA